MRPETRWVRHREVIEHLNLDPRTLRGLMRRTPPAAACPWVDVGLGKQSRFRWESLAAAEEWLRAVGAPDDGGNR